MILVGTAGADALTGGLGDDTLDGLDGADLLTGAQGDDTVTGGDGLDRFEFSSGDGLDTITDFELGDRIFVDGVEISGPNSLPTGVTGVDGVNGFEIHYGNGDVITLTGVSQQGFQEIANHMLFGTNSNDTIEGTTSDDVFWSNPGNDHMRGNGGNDVYYVDFNSGADSLVEWQNNTSDRMVFGPGIALSDLSAEAIDTNGNGHLDLKITNTSTGGSITIYQPFRSESWWHDRMVDWFEFADGTVMSHEEFFAATYFQGTTSDDVLHGTRGSDTFTGGLGDDFFRGSGGNDVYLVGKDNGDDRLVEWFADEGDRIIFDSNISLQDIVATAEDVDGNGHKDLKIAFANGTGTIAISEAFRAETWWHDRMVDWFEFGDGTVMSHEEFFAETYYQGTSGDDTLEGTRGSDTFTGGLGNDLFRGNHGNDTYIVNKGQGDDFLVEWGNFTDDRIVFGANQNEVAFSRGDFDGDGHDDLRAAFTDGSGSITVKQAFRNVPWVHDRQVDWFEFSDGTVLNHDDIIV